MKISDAILNLCEQNLLGDNNWYNWRKIDESIIPHNIKLPDGNQYQKNIALKRALHESWKDEKDLLKRGNLIEYYIKNWGGIKGNKVATMQEYRNNSHEQLIARGIAGIASWSKALVVHDYNKYAIFDARVSNSLNCLQIIYRIKSKFLYPTLASQNKTIIASNKKIKQIARAEKWSPINDTVLYPEYLRLIELVAKDANSNMSTVEMLLFAKGEELASQIL